MLAGTPALLMREDVGFNRAPGGISQAAMLKYLKVEVQDVDDPRNVRDSTSHGDGTGKPHADKYVRECATRGGWRLSSHPMQMPTSWCAPFSKLLKIAASYRFRTKAEAIAARDKLDVLLDVWCDHFGELVEYFQGARREQLDAIGEMAEESSDDDDAMEE